MNPTVTSESTDQSVADRYSAAAKKTEAALCCPVNYDKKYLAVIPDEIINRDYGCGDPTSYVQAGDTVVDLGSGAGKNCYITAQVVGSQGRVIGVDCNQDMLALARSHQQDVADRIGFANVEFRFGRIQDLVLDLDQFTRQIDDIPAGPARSLDILNLASSLRRDRPMIATGSVDCVISNCVLNLVNPADRTQLFEEIYRVLKNGGRAAISDIVCDETVPTEMQANAHLWSGCISGAWREDLFLRQFQDAEFHGIHIENYQIEPWQVVNGIEFRSVTVVAHKGKAGPCLERNQAVIYQGPFSRVEDDDGHVYQRGERTAVCDKTFQLLAREPYASMFVPIEPKDEVSLDQAQEFDCTRNKTRHPRETKGQNYAETRVVEMDGCVGDGPCC